MKLRRLYVAALTFAVLFLAASFSQVPAPTRGGSAPAFEAQRHRKPNEFSVNTLPLKLPLVDPKIVVWKSRRRLMLYTRNKLVRVYRVGLGTDPVHDKIKEGDRRTPEGEFY